MPDGKYSMSDAECSMRDAKCLMPDASMLFVPLVSFTDLDRLGPTLGAISAEEEVNDTEKEEEGEKWERVIKGMS